jgi:hypothetical protein
MARQPFSTRFPNSKANFGPELFGSRPRAAMLIAQCIAGWTEVEIQTARLLAQLLHAKSEPVIALYLTLANERAKREALYAIADFVLEDERDLFDAIMTAKGAVAKERHDLAHGIFGATDQDPTGVLWISTKDRIKHFIEIDSIKHADGRTLDAYQPMLNRLAFHYTIDDIISIFDDIKSIHRIIYNFRNYLDDDYVIEPRDQLYLSICVEPLVVRFQSQKDASLKSGE